MDGLSVLRYDKLSSELGLHLKAAIKKFSNNFNRITKSNTIITLRLNLVQFKEERPICMCTKFQKEKVWVKINMRRAHGEEQHLLKAKKSFELSRSINVHRSLLKRRN